MAPPGCLGGRCVWTRLLWSPEWSVVRTTVASTIWAQLCFLKMTFLGPGIHQHFTVSYLYPIHPQRHLCLWMVTKLLLLSRDARGGPPVPLRCWHHSPSHFSLIDMSQLSTLFITLHIGTGLFDHLLIYGPLTGWGILTFANYAVRSLFPLQFYICLLLSCLSLVLDVKRWPC